MKKEPPENGLHIKYYEHGQIKSMQKYKDGSRHGEFIEWYESGQKKSEGNFEDDKISGRWSYWDENGKIESFSLYKLRNYKKFIRPHIAIIFILLTLKIILGFLNLHPFWSLFSDPVIYISGTLIGLLGATTYKEFIHELTLISLVAIVIIQYQWPVGMPMSIFGIFISFFDILLIALVVNIFRVTYSSDYHQNVKRTPKNGILND